MDVRKKTGAGQVSAALPILAVALLMLYIFRAIGGFGGFPGGIGEEAAILSAAINMPDSGLGILLERFRGSIYPPVLPPEDATAPDDSDEAVSSVREWPPSEVLRNAEPVETEPPAAGSTLPESSAAERAEIRMPKIPEKYAAPVISENFAGGSALITYGDGYIKNDTRIPDSEINGILETPFSLDFEDTDEPQVLIVHTHATESYEKYDRDIYDTRNTWRSTDNSNNMAAVGDAMCEILEENGIAVIHDTTQHDYPSYNGSYERSAATISEYLERYPSIKVVLDLHRDAMQRDDAIIKPVAVIDGVKAAQIMIITPCDDGKMNIPEWRENLRFAAAFQDYMERYYKELTKPAYLCYRKYNMDLTTGSLLLEFGSNANTLDEAMYSARMAAQALSKLIWDTIQAVE